MREVPIILFGIGGVGQSLLRQIQTHRSFHAIQYGLRLAISAICDSDGAVIASGGDEDTELSDELIADARQLKQDGQRLAQSPVGGPQTDLAAIVDIAGRANTIVVDCTASEHTISALLFALERGYKIVLANKKPLTSELKVYRQLTGGTSGLGATARAGSPSTLRHLGRSRWETTVGAGLPVIAALNRIFSSGDEVRRIAGAFSGTLGYVMTGLQQERPFSEIVREAHKLGYTEPDPRDDLGGVDVARKALILARGLGWQLEMRDVEVAGLYPPEMDELPVDGFLEEIAVLDDDFRQQVQQAGHRGKALRYAATVADGACRVGPVIVEQASPLGRLSGTDNLVEFHTTWYNPNPLVVQGSGAGTDVTAAGVLGDILELVYTV